MILSNKEIQFGFNYFHKDEKVKSKSVVELSKYHGESALTINCTQLGEYSQKEKNKILKFSMN